ncbi:hypothetical protein D3C73_1393190 [compost metagenome]
MHRPLGPGIKPRQIRRIARFFIAIRQRQKRRHGIDVFSRRAFCKAVGKPAIDDIAHRFITGLLVILVHPVQADAVRPFPSSPPFGVNNASVVQSQQELTALIMNIDQIMRHLLDERF